MLVVYCIGKYIFRPVQAFMFIMDVFTSCMLLNMSLGKWVIKGYKSKVTEKVEDEGTKVEIEHECVRQAFSPLAMLNLGV